MPFDPTYGNLSDDELITLARDAGYLSNGESNAAPDPLGSYNDMEEPEQERQDFRTWVPQVSPTISEPPQAAPEQGQAPTSTRQSSSYGASASGRGFSPGKYAELSKTDQELNYDLGVAEDEAMQREARMEEPTALAYGSKVDAERAKVQAEVDAIKGKGEQALVMQRLQDEFSVEEAKANAMAQAQANQSKADYMAALADFRASRVDPSQLWKNMTGGERFGTLVTAFVHDFLGAKGINTSAMSTLNKAIDRNIDAQVAAIKTKGEVAEGFKSLWWMQRNQSASDTEARARVRGFLLESAKQAVIANMTKYESALASAQGQQAVAKIDEEFAKNLVDIYKHSDANAISLRNQAIEKWRTKIMAASESWANSIRQQEANTNAYRATKEGKSDQPRLIHDPETGNAVGYFQPGLSDAEMAKATEVFVETKITSDAMKKLRELVRTAKPVIDPVAGTRFADTDQQKFDALSVKLAHQMIKAMGERATEPDVQQMLKAMRPKSYLNQADAEKVLAFMQENVIAPAQATYSGYAYDLPESSPLRGLKAGKGSSIMAGEHDEAKYTSNPPPPSQREREILKAIESVSGPAGREPYTGENTAVQKAHAAAQKFDSSIFSPDESVPITAPGGHTYGEGKITRPIRKFEKAMVDLQTIARGGGVEGKKAMDHLINLAGPYLNNLPGKDDESAFAALMLSTMDE